MAQGSFSVDRHQEFQIRLAIAAISSLRCGRGFREASLLHVWVYSIDLDCRLHDSTHLSNSMGRLALCIGGHDAGDAALHFRS